jgi:hypothetical protein
MGVTCSVCEKEFEATSKRARYCSSTCRSRSHRRAKRGEVVVHLARPGSDPASVAAGGIAEALEGELRDRENAASRLALRLASDVDAMSSATPGYASVVKELRASLSALGLSKPTEDSRTGGKVAQFRARRATASGT